MPLINCEECAHTISAKADACPHCGAKRRVNIFRKGADAVIDMLGGIALWTLKISLILCGIYLVIQWQLENLWEKISSVLPFVGG